MSNYLVRDRYLSSGEILEKWKRYYPVVVELGYNLVYDNEVQKWLDLNCGPRADTYTDPVGKWVYWSSKTFLFKDEHVAMMFKLRWA